jgi:hypothetical protein
VDLKGDLLQSRLTDPKKILITRVGERIRIPSSRNDKETAEALLIQLLYFKKEVEYTVDTVRKIYQ